MIAKRQGVGIAYEEEFYFVGDKVIANDKSDYNRLKGVITEIRTGDDKDTENEGIDIYVAFEVPEHKGLIYEIERRFSGIFGEEKSIHDLGLDEVIVSQEMIDVQ